MRQQSLRTFSLVELLTAIVVVGTLAATLAPVLSAGREASEKAICLSNLRQVAMAALNYSRDHDGYLPQVNWGPLNDGWLYLAPLQPDDDTDPLSPLRGGQLWPYLQDPEVYRCPTDWRHSESALFQARNQQFSSYVMNGSAQGYGPYDLFRVEDFAPDAIMFWEASELLPFYYNDGANYPTEGVSFRHDLRAHVARIDGHVESMPSSEWNTEEVQRPGRLWNSPLSDTGD